MKMKMQEWTDVDTGETKKFKTPVDWIYMERNEYNYQSRWLRPRLFELGFKMNFVYDQGDGGPRTIMWCEGVCHEQVRFSRSRSTTFNRYVSPAEQSIETFIALPPEAFSDEATKQEALNEVLDRRYGV